MAVHLGKELGVTVEFVPSADYKASVEMFKNGQIQLAWFGGVTGVQARHAVPGARAIVQGKEDLAFVSYFIAHKDTGLTKSADFPMAIAPFKFTFGADTSTSGRVMPEHFIRKFAGSPSDQFFKQRPSFSGSHDKTCELVGSGQFQAGVVDFAVYNKRVADKKTDPDVCRVIWESPPFPDYNFTVHPSIENDFGAGFTQKLQMALIDMTTKNPELLKAFPRSALIEATSDQFAPLEQVCRELGFLR
jgi:phosphonate transport system substrate-binding protein